MIDWIFLKSFYNKSKKENGKLWAIWWFENNLNFFNAVQIVQSLKILNLRSCQIRKRLVLILNAFR